MDVATPICDCAFAQVAWLGLAFVAGKWKNSRQYRLLRDGDRSERQDSIACRGFADTFTIIGLFGKPHPGIVAELCETVGAQFELRCRG